MVAVGKTGGQLITYSDRFSYSGMAAGAAVFPANIKPALAKIKGTTGPPTQDKTAKPGDANPAAPDAAEFEATYTMQTGATRYAPMQPVPPTKVTATDTKPLYPTSSVRIAKSKLPPPDVQTTITASQTFSVSSRENTVCYMGQSPGMLLTLTGRRRCPRDRRHGQVPQPLEGLGLRLHQPRYTTPSPGAYDRNPKPYSGSTWRS